jgi:hypothetical protein
MSDLFKDQADLLCTKSSELKTLIGDIYAMAYAAKTKTVASRKTVEPMTRLRKNVSELEEAKKNPDEQFVKDRIKDIIGI